MNIYDTHLRQWLLQPGNHRILRELSNAIKTYIDEDLRIDSWSALYRYFELVTRKQHSARALFDPLFNKMPPCPKLGATQQQLMLYRGAKPISTAA